MEQPLQITLAFAIGAYLLFVMAYRGIILRRVMGITGRKTPENPSYYLSLLGFLLASGLLLVIAGTRIHQTYGWWGVSGYAAVFGALFWFTLRFRRMMRGAIEGMSQPMSFSFSLRRSTSRKRQGEKRDTEHSPRMWTLAAVSLLSKVEGKDYFLLGGMEPTPKRVKAAQKRLRKLWDINNDDRFQEECDWLFEYGHRKEFHDMIQKVSAFSEEETFAYLQEIEEGKYGLDSLDAQADERHRVDMARTNQGNIRQISFIAWDYLRYISLTREGFLAEYIDEAEAWNQLFSAAQILQSRYDSWRDMSKAFVLAREFWSKTESQRDGLAYQRGLKQLEADEKSPWNTIPWELPLYSRR